MQFENFKIRPFNSHFEDAYGDIELEWLRTCAIDKANNLQTLMNAISVETVLEVGCGSAVVLAEVARRGIGREHVGIDLVDPRVHLDASATQLNVLAYDGVSIPFSTNAFDLVYASHVIEHVPDPRALLAEISRVSKRFVYVEVPCELHFRTSRRALQTSLDIGHINAYTPESFVILLQTAGLKIKEVQLFDHSRAVHSFHTSLVAGTVKGLIRSALLRLSPVLASRTFTYHCGALCTNE